MAERDANEIDWSLTTWEGARREQRRRWAELPLERIVAALEEMQELSEWLASGASASNRHQLRDESSESVDIPLPTKAK
jgi:hypothetical protein